MVVSMVRLIHWRVPERVCKQLAEEWCTNAKIALVNRQMIFDTS